MSEVVTINGRHIGPGFQPYIIAEMSANHNGSIEAAFKIIEEAKKAGADAVKIQTYRPDTITLDSDLPDFQITGGLWKGRTLYQLYDWAHTPWEWHGPLFEYARKLGITIFSSPFDHTAVDLLESLNAPAYKIASFEVVDLPLIKYVAQTGKPMIMSTGMADEEEIREAVATARDNGCGELVVLHCVSAYPAPAADYNLRTLRDIAMRFGVMTGLSDHTIDNATAVAAVALGACVIEKHVALDRGGGGPDDSFSLVPAELARLCADAKTAWESLGAVSYERKESEKGNMVFRRSLYVIKDMKAGEILSPENVKSVRPGYGLAPKYYEKVLGRRVSCNIRRATALTWEMIADL